MLDLRTLIRPLLAAPFIVGGIQAFRAPQPTPPQADDVARQIGSRLGLTTDPETLVKVNAATQVGGGMLLAVGFMPRLASLVLSASLVPTTLLKHRFWLERDGSRRNEHISQFATNAGLLGGLLAAALDTGGRPSVFWSSRRAADRAAHTVADTVSTAYRTLPGV